MSKKEYPAKLTTGYYRVREIWEDEASQLGAYRLLANAKAKCDENPGSRVFDNDGNVIYPEEVIPATGADEGEEKAVVDEVPDAKEAVRDGNETTENESDENSGSKEMNGTDVESGMEADEENSPGTEKESDTETGISEKGVEEAYSVDEEEFPTAEELPTTIAYGKLKTLMNIRKKPDLESEIVTVYKKNTIVDVVQFCNGWLKIKCAEAEDGVAYVLNSADTYAFMATKIYSVVPGDNLWKIAENKLGDGSRCADIRILNGLTSNAIRVGMKLLIP